MIVPPQSKVGASGTGARRFPVWMALRPESVASCTVRKPGSPTGSAGTIGAIRPAFPPEHPHIAHYREKGVLSACDERRVSDVLKRLPPSEHRFVCIIAAEDVLEVSWVRIPGEWSATMARELDEDGEESFYFSALMPNEALSPYHACRTWEEAADRLVDAVCRPSNR